MEDAFWRHVDGPFITAPFSPHIHTLVWGGVGPEYHHIEVAKVLLGGCSRDAGHCIDGGK